MLHVHNPAPPRHDPVELFRLAGGRTARIRPLRVEDAALYPAFDAGLSDEDRRFRFFPPRP